MARLNQIVDSDDEFPDLSTILRGPAGAGVNENRTTERASKKRDESGRSPNKRKDHKLIGAAREDSIVPGNDNRLLCDEEHESEPQAFGQLRSTDINSLFLRYPKQSLDKETKVHTVATSVRTSPRRRGRAQVDYSHCAPRLSDTSLSFSDDDSFTDLSGFIVPDSASDEEVLPSSSQKKEESRRSKTKSRMQPAQDYASNKVRSPVEELESTGPIDLTSPKKEKKTPKHICSEFPPRFETSPRISERSGYLFDLDEPFSKLRFSPPRSKLPYKLKDGPRPVTPPSSPTKAVLKSPSKSHRIPASPHRPSIDAFWSADVINDWNEQYSPKKALKSPCKTRLRSVDEDNGDLSPSESPRKCPSKSPAKKDRKSIDRRKAFDEKKHALASSFLADVDLAVGDGQVAAMADSTGGIKIIWSKKLSTTAGRANWRREAVRSKNGHGSISTTYYRHYASIELAEKVIDDEDRLTNVIAHEYCHLANFMISGIKDNPHGASFKKWAAKCTRIFKGRNINVTTKHTYEITYKYIWACSSETCGLEYKRHSKSIDPAKHSCGSCKSKLVQVQPVPRKVNAEGGVKRSEYQEYVKKEHERVRSQNPGVGFGEITAILGREYRESKKPSAALEDVEIGTQSVAEKEDMVGDDYDLDDVAGKLVTLYLEA